MTEDEVVRWHHRLKGHEFAQTLGDNEGQGGLKCCSPWGCKESDMTATAHAHITYLLTSLAVPGLSCGTWDL